MTRPKQIQLLLTERLYPDMRKLVKEIRAWGGFTTNAQAAAFALRALHKRLAKGKDKESRRVD